VLDPQLEAGRPVGRRVEHEHRGRFHLAHHAARMQLVQERGHGHHVDAVDLQPVGAEVDDDAAGDPAAALRQQRSQSG
jgi:hypothetical protein